MQPRRHSGGAERSDLRTLPPHRTAGNPAPSSRRDLPIPRLRPGRAARRHRPTAPHASSAAPTASARPYGKERLRRRNQAQAPACPRRRPQRKVRTRPRNGARTSERVTTPSSARPPGRRPPAAPAPPSRSPARAAGRNSRPGRSASAPAPRSLSIPKAAPPRRRTACPPRPAAAAGCPSPQVRPRSDRHPEFPCPAQCAHPARISLPGPGKQASVGPVTGRHDCADTSSA